MLLLAVGCRRWLLLLSSPLSPSLSPSLPVAAVAAGRAAVLCCFWPRPGFPLCPAAPPRLSRFPACSSVSLVFPVWSPVPGPVGFAVPAVLRGFLGLWVGSGLWFCFLLFGLWGWWWSFPVLALSAVPSSGALGSPPFWPLTRRFRISGFLSFCMSLTACLSRAVSGFQSFSGSMLPLGSLAVLAVPRFAPAGPHWFRR